MSNTLTIYKRELGSYFTSPIAYIFICAFLVVMAVYFFLFNGFFQQQNPDLRSYFVAFPFAFALLIPAVTMRLWSEEKKSGTLEILMTLPFKSWEVVLGKFLAGYSVIALTLALTLTIPISVAFVLELDWGVVVSSYLGALLLAAVYVGVGSWISALTQNQIVALLAAMVILFVLWGIGIPQVMQAINTNIASGLGNTIGWFGTFYHFQEFAKGVPGLVHFVYAGGLTAFFLILNNFAVEWRKY